MSCGTWRVDRGVVAGGVLICVSFLVAVWLNRSAPDGTVPPPSTRLSPTTTDRGLAVATCLENERPASSAQPQHSTDTPSRESPANTECP
jgi:hypothetical protein